MLHRIVLCALEADRTPLVVPMRHLAISATHAAGFQVPVAASVAHRFVETCFWCPTEPSRQPPTAGTRLQFRVIGRTRGADHPPGNNPSSPFDRLPASVTDTVLSPAHRTNRLTAIIARPHDPPARRTRHPLENPDVASHAVGMAILDSSGPSHNPSTFVATPCPRLDSLRHTSPANA